VLLAPVTWPMATLAVAVATGVGAHRPPGQNQGKAQGAQLGFVVAAVTRCQTGLLAAIALR
jgi:hypothetical protein